jgi:molybdopterin molybdotransferase
MARKRFLSAIPQAGSIQSEIVPTEEALGRVLAEAITAPHPLPPFARSSVDGFVVQASDTFGASPSLPAYLVIIGEILMGSGKTLTLESGQAALIHTGGMIPSGADAVVMIEDTQSARSDEVEILNPVSVGENVIPEGEDIAAGEDVLDVGIRLRPQEIGGLMAIGVTNIPVMHRPKVAILSTGDEIISPSAEPSPGQVRDVNSYTLSALVTSAGGMPIRYGIIPDQYKELDRIAQEAHTASDFVIITAGSSVSTRDITADVIAGLGKPGILVHGISIKPGKPTILAVADSIPVIGLPGNPVSALIAARLFALPVIHQLLQMPEQPLEARIPARLSLNIASLTGREDYVPVLLESTPDGYLAKPIFGRSNLIFTLARANGLIRIPSETTGLMAGTVVEVMPF